MVSRRSASVASALAGCLCVGPVCAQGIATDRLIDSITVTAARDRAVTNVPNPVASRTQEDLRVQNLFNPEDALRYVPNLTIRKRYNGDRNALIGGRSFSTLQSARGLVLMDGYLLSNFLGRFDAPRWNMIAPEEIDRVDVLYGPYSALYPGNSIGTTIAVRTRRPEQLELSVRTSAFSEQFDEYGVHEDFSGHQISAFFGNRFENGLWLSIAANRQDATGHPMQYYTVAASASGTFPNVSSDEAVPVTGVRFDTDPQGRRRAVFGASAGAIDHTVQDYAKLKSGYALNEWFEIEGFLALWRNESSAKNRTFMRDSEGREVWSGPVIADGVAFNVPVTALAPSERDERHSQWGATLRTTRASGWNGSLVYSVYEIREDSQRDAGAPDPIARLGTSGTNTERDGTGWHTLEAQATYTPIEGDWTGGAHTISLGVHRNEYELRNPVFETADWHQRTGVLAQNVFGETRMTALYAQDEWQLADAWSLTFGVRYEEWRAFRGGQRIDSVAIDYPAREKNAWSPKASLAFAPSSDWSIRLSAGRGVRFPTVSELFQGTTTSSSIIVNDPNLQPERSDSLDLTYEQRIPWGTVRASLFQDDVRDSIFAQTNITVTPSVTNVQNVDRVRTRGIEAAFAIDGLGLDAVRLEGSLAYARAKILENDNFPVSVGNYWPRVPKWRGNLQAVWQPNTSWLASLGMRYSGRMYNRLENDDIHPDTYGGVSRFTMFDARIAYTFANRLELALGVDNLTNERSYQSHPLQTRTAFLEARWSFQET